jgi:hypothetical protein
MCDAAPVRILALMLLLGCSSPAKKTVEPPSPTTADDPTCPIVVPGTSITVEEAAEGPAFVFVTTGDVGEVRKRAGALAMMHNQRGGPESALGMMFSVKATATASDIEGGSRVVFAGDPEVVDSMRAHAKMFEGRTSCEMQM